MIFRLISIELYKIFRKWRTYIGFFAIGSLVPLIHISFYLASDEGQFALSRLEESFMFAGNLVNGYLVTYLILNSLFVHIPFLIVLVGGDLLAGEATGGTYRMLVSRPVSRFQIVTSKFLAGIIYTLILILFLAFMSLGLGLMIFGDGVLAVFSSGKIIVFAENDVLWRFFGAFSFAVLSMSVITSLAFFFSSLVENAIGPIITTMAILIVFFILSVMDISFISSIKPFMFTTYLPGWLLFFEDPVDYAKIWKNASVLFAHVAVLYGAALTIFRRKDILS